MPVACSEIFKLVEELAPLYRAESWDNCGLQVGDPSRPVSKVLLALDVDMAVAKEAAGAEAGLIVSHHPLIFQPFRSLDLSTPKGKLIAYLMQKGLVVYSAHTNLDAAAGGVGDALAEKLGLLNVSVLPSGQRERLFKLAVYVPAAHADKVRSSICEAGAGWIGKYSHCTFAVTGTGTFLPREGAKPYIGQCGRLEQVEELRLETVVPQSKLAGVIEAMQKAHPYEEVAYDVYRLENSGPPVGSGRLGDVAGEITFGEFIGLVKERLGIRALRAGGPAGAAVKRVAVCGGAGAELWPAAARSGADTLLTGDIKYHTAREMLQAGLKFIDAGHFGTEAVVLEKLKNFLTARCAELGMEVEFLVFQKESDPFVYY